MLTCTPPDAVRLSSEPLLCLEPGDLDLHITRLCLAIEAGTEARAYEALCAQALAREHAYLINEACRSQATDRVLEPVLFDEPAPEDDAA